MKNQLSILLTKAQQNHYKHNKYRNKNKKIRVFQKLFNSILKYRKLVLDRNIYKIFICFICFKTNYFYNLNIYYTPFLNYF